MTDHTDRPASTTVSVVVVSRARPDALALCLTGLGLLDFPAFEVVVVACPAGRAAVDRHALGQRVKSVAFDEPNISAARNLGVAQAAGDIVAFIDDDAVPEPLWLHHLAAPFADPEVAAAGGYVLGRNGISFQWRARSVDRRGQDAPLALPDDRTRVLSPAQGRAIKTEGTNMALRRDLLAEMGGFDPAFRFYLDETDLNMRLARAGRATAVVPLAQVHHGYAASARRHADRTPRDLGEIGASMAVFLRKHCPVQTRAESWAAFRTGQRQRLLRAMQAGPLGPDDVRRLLRGLDAGYRAGLDRALEPMPRITRAANAFLPFPGRPGAARSLIAGRPWQAKALAARAKEAAGDGGIVTLLRLSPGTLYHRVRLHPDGYWEQTGGIWGRSIRNQKPNFGAGFRARVAQETARTAPVRGG